MDLGVTSRGFFLFTAFVGHDYNLATVRGGRGGRGGPVFTSEVR